MRYIALAALLVVLAGAWSYRAYFSSTNAALRHAEAFLFRRMSVAQLAEQGEYRFFYATNRTPGTDDNELAQRFTSERDDSLSFGSFDAAIRPSLGIGMLVNPTEWLQNEEIRLDNVNSLARVDFVGQLREQVASSPHRALLLVLHGFREGHES
ncbi:MAG: hypothetical protein ABJK20_00855, partial [Halieaceae bacterium]